MPHKDILEKSNNSSGLFQVPYYQTDNNTSQKSQSLSPICRRSLLQGLALMTQSCTFVQQRYILQLRFIQAISLLLENDTLDMSHKMIDIGILRIGFHSALAPANGTKFPWRIRIVTVAEGIKGIYATGWHLVAVTCQRDISVDLDISFEQTININFIIALREIDLLRSNWKNIFIM